MINIQRQGEPVAKLAFLPAPEPVALAAEPTRFGIELPRLLQLWRVVQRRRWVILAIVLAAVLLGVLATFLMTPRYTAVATIEISRQQDRVVQVQDVRPESGAVDQEFYQTQYSLLTARSLADGVANELKLADDPRFFETMKIKLGEGGMFGPEATRRPNAQQRAERQRKAVDKLLKEVDINPIRGSRLVEIGFTSPDPQLSMRLANAWSDRFIKSNLSRRFDATSYARTFLEGRLEQLRQRLEASERQLVAYAARERIINLPTTGGNGNASDRPIVADDLTALNASLSQAIADRVQAESRAQGRGTTGAGASAEALGNGAITALRQRRAEVAADYAKLLVQFEPGYPAARALQRQIADLDNSIAREESRVGQSSQTAFREALAREQGLQSRVETLKSNLLDLRRRSIQYNIYQRDVDTNRQLYDGLLQRYKEIGIAAGVGTNNIAVVDTAELPQVPSSPRLLLNLLAALALGLIAAALTVFLLEQIDEAIKDPAELERTLELPTLGVVPRTDGSPLTLLQDRKSAPAEAYLSMQTNLQFSSDHGVPRTLAVTSTRPAEGKSTTAYAIALTLARTGRKVVLVDCDMRSPSVHEMVGIPNTKGVSNFLAGDDALGAMIVNEDALGVAVLVAGKAPPNAAELLTGVRLPMLFERLLETYQHVVVDCPPVLGLADAPLVASQVEGVVYAVRARGPRARLVRQAVTRLRSANAHLLGTVLTMFEVKRAHYGYGYDYGYGYGHTTGTKTFAD